MEVDKQEAISTNLKEIEHFLRIGRWGQAKKSLRYFEGLGRKKTRLLELIETPIRLYATFVKWEITLFSLGLIRFKRKEPIPDNGLYSKEVEEWKVAESFDHEADRQAKAWIGNVALVSSFLTAVIAFFAIFIGALARYSNSTNEPAPAGVVVGVLFGAIVASPILGFLGYFIAREYQKYYGGVHSRTVEYVTSVVLPFTMILTSWGICFTVFVLIIAAFALGEDSSENNSGDTNMVANVIDIVASLMRRT